MAALWAACASSYEVVARTVQVSSYLYINYSGHERLSKVGPGLLVNLGCLQIHRQCKG